MNIGFSLFVKNKPSGTEPICLKETLTANTGNGKKTPRSSNDFDLAVMIAQCCQLKLFFHCENEPRSGSAEDLQQYADRGQRRYHFAEHSIAKRRSRYRCVVSLCRLD